MGRDLDELINVRLKYSGTCEVPCHVRSYYKGEWKVDRKNQLAFDVRLADYIAFEIDNPEDAPENWILSQIHPINYHFDPRAFYFLVRAAKEICMALMDELKDR